MNGVKPILFYILLVLSSCREDAGMDPTGAGEWLYLNGQIYTVNPSQEWAEAMLVEDGVIRAIGTNEAVRDEASDNAQTVDLGNNMVMPGIHAVHLHP